MKNTLVVNLMAGPGAGKSTLAAASYAAMKFLGFNAEVAREYVKDFAWSGEARPPQARVWRHQREIVDHMMGKVDVIICESPPILSLIYDDGDSLDDMYRFAILGHHYAHRNRMDVWVQRRAPYRQSGRFHNEAEAVELDTKISQLLPEYDLRVTGDVYGVRALVDEIEYRLKNPL